MEQLQQYGAADASSSGDEGDAATAVAALRARAVAAAPAVDTSGLVLADGEARAAADVARAPPLDAKTLRYNPTVSELYGGGRADAAALTDALRNHVGGHVEDVGLPSAVFEAQYNAFHARGRAEAPDGRMFGRVATAIEEPEAKRKRTGGGARREAAAVLDSGGAWRLRAAQPWADKEVKAADLTEEQREYLAKVAAEKAENEAAAATETPGATTKWHGKETQDWQGKSWLAAPKKSAHAPDTCFLPKRWTHTWGADGSGHKKGVNSIKFFPKTGHLLLSAGLDGDVKIWDVGGSGKAMRTYCGHSAGVRQANFNHDGTRFVSVAYDKQMHLWDTETGKVIQTIRSGAVFYCATLHPEPAKSHMVLAGASDKKVYQFDFNSGDLIQEYHYHIGAVNTVTFIEENRMFVSSADDKTLRVWELGVPVQVKVVADPAMHSMPAVARHPNGKMLAFQSLDSRIVTYSCTGKFRPNKKKVFSGHLVGGTACQVGFSPDGKFIMSGDAQGKLFFWDWGKPNRIVKTIPAHDKTACIGCEWHPLETSKVATCGWDGLIKYWD